MNKCKFPFFEWELRRKYLRLGLTSWSKQASIEGKGRDLLVVFVCLPSLALRLCSNEEFFLSIAFAPCRKHVSTSFPKIRSRTYTLLNPWPLYVTITWLLQNVLNRQSIFESTDFSSAFTWILYLNCIFKVYLLPYYWCFICHSSISMWLNLGINLEPTVSWANGPIAETEEAPYDAPVLFQRKQDGSLDHTLIACLLGGRVQVQWNEWARAF